jgi:hypothetical protein
MFTSNSRTPKVYDQVIEQIKSKIKNGEIKREIDYHQKEKCQNLSGYLVHL